MPLRRRSQSDRGAARAGVAVVDDARRESPADVSRSPSRIRQQPDWRAAQRSVAADAAARSGRHACRRCRCSTIRSRMTCPARVMPVRLRLVGSVGVARRSSRTRSGRWRRWHRATAPLARWTAAADAWCAAAFWPGPRAIRPASSANGSPPRPAHRRRCPMRSCRRRSTRAREIAAEPRRVSLGARVSGSLLRRRRAARRRRRLRRGDRQPAVGHAARDRSSSNADASVTAALAFCRRRVYRIRAGIRTATSCFVDRALQLARPGGRVGLILPSGIATDHGSAALRRHLFDRTSIDTWLGFDNRGRIFPIHRSVRFVVLATTNGGSHGRRCGSAAA